MTKKNVSQFKRCVYKSMLLFFGPLMNRRMNWQQPRSGMVILEPLRQAVNHSINQMAT